MRAYSSAVESGDISGDNAYLLAYGIYLFHGGKPSDFDEMTADDIQILLSTYLAVSKRHMNYLSNRIWQFREE